MIFDYGDKSYLTEFKIYEGVSVRGILLHDIGTLITNKVGKLMTCCVTRIGLDKHIFEIKRVGKLVKIGGESTFCK